MTQFFQLFAISVYLAIEPLEIAGHPINLCSDVA